MKLYFVMPVLACAFISPAVAQGMGQPAASRGPSSPITVDTARFTMTLPRGFSEVSAAEKSDFQFVYSDLPTDPNSKRTLSITFFEGDKFRSKQEGFLLGVMAFGLSKQHTDFQTAEKGYLDGAKQQPCVKWTGDAYGQTFAGLGCEIRTPTGFALIHAIDLASSYSNDEEAFRSSMLSFRLKK